MTKSPRAKRGPVPIAEIIAVVSQGLGKEGAKQEKISSLWQRAVGEKRASHTKVSTFEGGTLTVLVDSSSQLYELSLEKDEILQKLRREFGEKKVGDVRFQIG